MKVVVDYDLCEANALCMDCCPEVFRVEEDDTLTVLMDEIPEDLRGKVEEAAHLVAWLCSADCSFSTGAVFDLSGGRATY